MKHGMLTDNKTTIIAVILILFSPLGIDLYLSAFPTLTKDFGIDASLTLSFFVLSMGIGQLFWGGIADKKGRKPIALIGLCFYSFASVMLCFTDNGYLFLFLRALQGFGASATSMCAFVIIRDCFSGKEAAKRYSIINGVLNIIPSLAPFIGVLLIYTWDWRACFLVLHALSALTFLVLWYHMDETLPSTSNQTTQGYTSILKEYDFVTFGLCCCLSMAVILSYVTVAPSILIEHYGLSEMTFSLLFALNALIVMSGSFVSLKLIHRFGCLKTLIIGCYFLILGGVLLGALNSIHAPLTFIVPIAITSIGFSFILGAASSLAMQPFTANAGKAGALLGCSQWMVASIISMLVNLFSNAIQLSLATSIVLCALLCLGLAKSHHHRSQNAEAVTAP